MRKGIDFMILLDISSSMQGLKIKQAVESIKFIVSKMKKFDRIGIVIFSSSTEILVPMIEINEKAQGLIFEAL